MNATAAELPYGRSEFEFAGLSMVPGESNRAPRIGESPVQMECRLERIIEIGSNRIILGLIDLVHVRDGIIDPRTFLPNPERYRPIARMHGADGYLRPDGLFTLRRLDGT
jgi:flavin reductase (DIM6/NTAB) family NADH-FMN oxidoreductase RutF